MGIESTHYVTREWAIARLLAVYDVVKDKHYRRLEEITFEDEFYRETEQMVKFFKETECFCEDDLRKWTDKMLEELIDQPYFRKSMLDNYIIGPDEDGSYDYPDYY